MALTDYTFGCHGIPERCFKFQGKHMPFCSRCLGASIGHISAAICFFTFKLPSIFIALLGLTIMFVDWYLQNQMKLYHSNVSRLLTGIIGGFCMGIIIWTTFEMVIKWIG